MNDSRQVLAKHLSELAFDFALDEFLDDGDRVESAVNINILQGISLEDEGYALLLGHDENDVRVEFKVREAKEHGDDKRLFCGKHASRTSHEMNIGLLMVEWVGLVIISNGFWPVLGCVPGLLCGARDGHLQST